MTSINMSYEDAHEPLIENENLPQGHVLVFSNPSAIRDYKPADKKKHFLNPNKDYTGMIKEMFERMFLDSKDLIIEEASKKIRSDDMNEFSKVVINTLLIKLQVSKGLRVQAWLSADDDQIFVILNASDENLKVQADLAKYYLQINEQAEKSTRDMPRESTSVNENQSEQQEAYQKVMPYGVFENSAAHYSCFQKYDTKDKKSNEGKLFRSIDRIRLIRSIVNSVCDLGLLTSEGILIAEFPLHTHMLEQLKKDWASPKKLFSAQPIDEIRNYFGEKITLYFEWLSYYTLWLCFPSLFGLIFAIIIYQTGGFDKESIISSVCILLFSLVLSIFSTLFDQYWLRREKTLAWEWGLTNYEPSEDQRPEFKGEYRADEVTGRNKKLNPSQGLTKIISLMGYGTILLFVGVVIAALVAIFSFKNSTAYEWGGIMAGAINAVQIKFLNFIYRIIARKMTMWENQETERKHYNSLSLKIFCFQFVNSYASLFYIAFFKGNSSRGCQNGDCLGELQLQVASIFITNVLLNFVEIAYPLVKYKCKLSKEQRHAKTSHKKMTKVEKEATKVKYNTPMDDYIEMIIAYGYLVLFGVAFPLIPVLALVLAFIEIRVDAWKICHLMLRPIPAQDNSIGVWVDVIQTVSYIGTAVNIGIVIFTGNAFNIQNTSIKWIIFLSVEHVLILLKSVISWAIPDVSTEVSRGLVWSQRRADEILNKSDRQGANLNFIPVERTKRISEY